MRAFLITTVFALTAGCQPLSGQSSSVSTSASSVATSTASDAASSNAVHDTRRDCHPVVGKISAVPTCLRLDLATGAITPRTERLMLGDPSVVAGQCDRELRLAHARLKIVCERLPSLRDAGSLTKPVIVSADVTYDDPDAAPPKRIRLDRYDPFWDFINIWARERDDGVDLTIDYGMLD